MPLPTGTDSGSFFHLSSDRVIIAAFESVAGAQRNFNALSEDKWPEYTWHSGKDFAATFSLGPGSDDRQPIEMSSPEAAIATRKVQDALQRLDMTAGDVFLAALILWRQQASHSDDWVDVEANDILRLRGRKEQRNGRGCRGGYQQSDRLKIETRLDALSCLRVTVPENYRSVPDRNSSVASTRVQRSALLEVEPVTEPKAGRSTQFRLRPGVLVRETLFAQRAPYMRLPLRVLQLDPYRRELEKLVAVRLYWLARIRQHKENQPLTLIIGSLLEATGLAPEAAGGLTQQRRRLEQALNVLKDEGIIACWRYEDGPPNRALLASRKAQQQWTSKRLTTSLPSTERAEYSPSRSTVLAGLSTPSARLSRSSATSPVAVGGQ